MEKVDPKKPFQNEELYQEFSNLFTNFEYKLYGKVDFQVVEKDDVEFDLYGGEIHYTERDMLAISKALRHLNIKWKTEITYCLFPSKKFPDGISINVRSPEAPQAS